MKPSTSVLYFVYCCSACVPTGLWSNENFALVFTFIFLQLLILIHRILHYLPLFHFLLWIANLTYTGNMFEANFQNNSDDISYKGDHPLTTYAKFSMQITNRTSYYVHIRLHTYLMDNPWEERSWSRNFQIK